MGAILVNLGLFGGFRLRLKRGPNGAHMGSKWCVAFVLTDYFSMEWDRSWLGWLLCPGLGILLVFCPPLPLWTWGSLGRVFSKFLEQILSLSEPHPPCLHVISDMPCSHESELFSWPRCFFPVWCHFLDSLLFLLSWGVFRASSFGPLCQPTSLAQRVDFHKGTLGL